MEKVRAKARATLSPLFNPIHLRKLLTRSSVGKLPGSDLLLSKAPQSLEIPFNFVRFSRSSFLKAESCKEGKEKKIISDWFKENSNAVSHLNFVPFGQVGQVHLREQTVQKCPSTLSVCKHMLDLFQ